MSGSKTFRIVKNIRTFEKIWNILDKLMSHTKRVVKINRENREEREQNIHSYFFGHTHGTSSESCWMLLILVSEKEEREMRWFWELKPHPCQHLCTCLSIWSREKKFIEYEHNTVAFMRILCTKNYGILVSGGLLFRALAGCVNVNENVH